jgi:hypothetical protein
LKDVSVVRKKAGKLRRKFVAVTPPTGEAATAAAPSA